jgi:hypothetical protein
VTHAFLPLSVDELAHEVAAIPAMGLTPEQGPGCSQHRWCCTTTKRRGRGAGDTRFVSDATHDIQFDRPDVVIRAIREVVAESVAK